MSTDIKRSFFFCDLNTLTIRYIQYILNLRIITSVINLEMHYALLSAGGFGLTRQPTGVFGRLNTYYDQASAIH